MYKYETHVHTFPVSRCAKADVEENLAFYREKGYDGIFITNHFLDGNINADPSMCYEDRIEFYFSDYEKALKIGKEIGIKVFCGVELSYGGTDFLVYGLDKEWFLAHPQIMDMKKSEELPLMMESGALVIQAHPFREANYIDHIRLFPRYVHGVEVVNGGQTEFVNAMAKMYCESYNLIEFAGTDNHLAGRARVMADGRWSMLAGMCSDAPVLDERDFVERVKAGKMKIFSQPF